jgi:hypothetical protein
MGTCLKTRWRIVVVVVPLVDPTARLGRRTGILACTATTGSERVAGARDTSTIQAVDSIVLVPVVGSIILCRHRLDTSDTMGCWLTKVPMSTVSTTDNGPQLDKRDSLTDLFAALLPWLFGTSCSGAVIVQQQKSNRKCVTQRILCLPLLHIILSFPVLLDCTGSRDLTNRLLYKLKRHVGGRGKGRQRSQLYYYKYFQFTHDPLPLSIYVCVCFDFDGPKCR